MTCEQAREQFADQAQSLDLQQHVAACAECRTELAEFQTTWTAAADIPGIEPSPHMRARFNSMLRRESQTSRCFAWWPRQPAWQFGFSFASLMMGLAIGHLLTAGRESAGQISELKEEIHSMRQLVTLSLLQQQSASERLKGVTWSYRMEQPDTEVLSALLRTINQDANVNVRLAAVDALRPFANSPVARRGLLQSLVKQTSPLMQITIVDLLTELKDRQAAGTLRTLLARPELDANVRRRIEFALRQLE